MERHIPEISDPVSDACRINVCEKETPVTNRAAIASKEIFTDTVQTPPCKRKPHSTCQYKCAVWDKIFESDTSLNEHMLQAVHGETSITRSPTVPFLAPRYLGKMKYVHKKKEYKCSECDKKFGTKWVLQAHKSVHTENKSLELQQLTNSNTSQQPKIPTLSGVDEQLQSIEFTPPVYNEHSETKNHLNKYVSKVKIEPTYSCPICDKTFGSTWSLQLHSVTHVAGNISSEDYINSLKPPEDLSGHLTTPKQDDNNKAHEQILEVKHNEYGIPDETYDSTESDVQDTDNNDSPLSQYLKPSVSAVIDSNNQQTISNEHSSNKTHHVDTGLHDVKLQSNLDKPLLCLLAGCTNRFKTRKQLKSHGKTVHSSIRTTNKPGCGERRTKYEREYRYECSNCDKKFVMKSALDRHKAIHESVGTIQCTEEGCDKLFKTQTYMSVHKSKCHIGRNYQCQECELKFKTNKELQTHQLVHTTERPFLCGEEDCNKTFKSKKHVSDHKRSVHGKKEHQCSVCGKLFRTLSLLKVHLPAHKSEKPVMCEVADCGKCFKTSKHLLRHRITIHSAKGHQCPVCFMVFPKYHTMRSHKMSIHGLGKRKFKTPYY